MTYAVVPLLVAALCLFLGKRLATLVVIIAYLNVEGFFKLLSNYNRIVHVGIDIIVLSLAVTWTAGAVLRRQARLPRLPWVPLILLYCFWVVLQVVHPLSPGLVLTAASFKLHLTMIPLYFMTAALVRERRDVVTLLAALCAVALVPFAVALTQYALGPQSVIDLSPRFAANLRGFHEWRPFGTSPTPGGTAVVAFLVTPLAVALLLGAEAAARYRLLAAVSIVLSCGVFVVSGVRQIFLGGLLAVLIAFALVGLRLRARGLVALASVLLLALGAYTITQQVLRPLATAALRADPATPAIWLERSVTDRLGTLGSARVLLTARSGGLEAIYERATRFPFGMGLGRTGSGAQALADIVSRDPEAARRTQGLRYTENFFAVMIQEVGLPGMLMLAVLLVGFPVYAARLARRTRDPMIGAAAAAIAGILLAVLFMSWGSQPFTSNPITAYYWLLAGTLAAMGRMEAETTATAGSPGGADEARALLP